MDESTRSLAVFGVDGRSIVTIIRHMVLLWVSHRATLVPDLDPAVVAALDVIAAALTAIEAINPPGPE